MPNQPSDVSQDQAHALRLRYDHAMPRMGPWNEHIALLMSHRSVRGYRPDPLPEGTLESLIAAAQSAATSSNLQSWSVIAVTDPAKKAAFAQIANDQKHIEQCPLFLVWLADLSRNKRLGHQEAVELEVLELTESFLVAAIDAALASQNAVVAAESLGLSTVYIGALRNDPERVSELLNLPPACLGVFGLCVGFAAPEAANEVKPRLPQEAVLFHETYDATHEQSLRQAYDESMARFSKRNEMVHDSWTERVIRRTRSNHTIEKRAHLKAILERLGFAMK
jgi:nitroreductase